MNQLQLAPKLNTNLTYDCINCHQLIGRQPPHNTPIQSQNSEFDIQENIETRKIFFWPDEDPNELNLEVADFSKKKQETYDSKVLKEYINQEDFDKHPKVQEIYYLKQRAILKEVDLLDFLKQKPMELHYTISNNASDSSRGCRKFYFIKMLESPKMRKRPSQQSHSSISPNESLFDKLAQLNITIVRQYEDPQLQQKKKEIQEQTKWLGIVSNEQDVGKKYMKDLKFKLNQLAKDNYSVIGEQIVKIIKSNEELLEESVDLIIDKAAIESKYRELYSQLVISLCRRQDKKKKSNMIYKNMFDKKLNDLILFKSEYDDIMASIENMNEEDRNIFLHRRKKRFIGTIKFVCQLFLDDLFSVNVVDDIMNILLYQFIDSQRKYTTKDQFYVTSYIEESFEGLLELLTFCGKQYFATKQKKQDVNDQKKFLQNFLAKMEISSNDQAFHFSQEGMVALQQIKVFLQFIRLNKINNELELSQRLQLLLKTLFELMDNNWEQIQQFRLSTQSKGSSQKEVDSSDDELQVITAALKKSRSSMMKMKIEKVEIIQEFKEQEDETSVMKPLTEKDLILQIDQIFKFHQGDRFFTSLQKQILNRISKQELADIFWFNFFANILNINKENVERAKLTFQIYQKNIVFSEDEHVFEILNEVVCIITLYYQSLQSKLFDLVESPLGITLMINMFQPFINANLYLMKKINLKESDSEIQDFLVSVFSTLVTQDQLNTPEKSEMVFLFLKDNLHLSSEQQQKFWGLVR